MEIVNAALNIDNDYFNKLLKVNKLKIDAITPKNPTITKDDEWNQETFWDTEYKNIMV